MIILPAVDLIGGMPVRLYQGDYSKKEIVAQSAIDTVKAFEKAGAGYVHMVDLDGARSGKRENAALIAEAASVLSVPVECGGGIRTMDDIEWYISHGISRVILGTAAIGNQPLLKEAIDRYGEKIAVGMDCRNGYVCTEGWLNSSDAYYLDFAKKLADMGVRNIIFTDISRDGTLKGPNLEMLKQLRDACGADITASGGVSSIDDVRALKELGVYGAIIGKAIYSGGVRLEDAVALCREEL